MSDFSPVGFRFGYLVLGSGIFLIAAVAGLQVIESNFSNDQKGKRQEMEIRDLVSINQARRRELIEEVNVEHVRREALREFRRKEAACRALETQVTQAREVLAKLKLKKAGLEDEIAVRIASLRDYRSEVRGRLWASAVGRRVKASDLIKSLPFEDMVISKVNEAGITVRHKTGVTGIPVSGIVPALRKTLDLELGWER